jgi:hypothetical protein
MAPIVNDAEVDRAAVSSAADRPVLSQDITGSPMTITVRKPLAAGGQATATGYRRGELVVSARLEL